MQEETVMVRKELLSSMVSDIESLLDDIEMIVNKGSTEEINKRMEEVKKGKVKGFTEADFADYVKKRR